MTTQQSPRPTFLTTLATVKLVGIPLASIIDAVPEALLAAAFVRGVLWPAAMPAGYLQWLFLVVIIEFLVLHSAGFVGLALVADGSRGRRIAWLLAISVAYLLLAVGIGLGLQSWYPVVTLAGLTLNRLLFILLHDTRTMSGLTKIDIRNEWAFGTAAYVLAMMGSAVVLINFSHYLWSPEVQQRAFVLPGIGDSSPELVAGGLYFIARAVRALFFTRELGTPGYARNAETPPAGGRVLGIHVGLWYVLRLPVVFILVVVGFLAVCSYLTGAVGLFVVFGACCLSIIMIGVVLVCVRVRRATLLLAGRGRPVMVTVLDVERDSRKVTHLAIPADETIGAPALDLTVEGIRRSRILPPGVSTIAGELFTSPDPTWPTVVRIGRTYLCTIRRG